MPNRIIPISTAGILINLSPLTSIILASSIPLSNISKYVQSLFGLIDSQPIQTPIKAGEVTLPYYEGHYYVAYTSSKKVIILI